MVARLSAFVIWALVAASMVFWGLRLLVRPDPAPQNAVVVGDSTASRGDLTQLLGAEPVAAVAVAPAMSTRFKLLGVMAAKAAASGPTPGFALISIDGKPPRAYAAGARVDEQLVLQTVSMRSASLGPAEGATSFVLEVPALPPPAVGVAPKAVMDPLPPSAAPVPPAAAAPPPAMPAAPPVRSAMGADGQPPPPQMQAASGTRMPRGTRPVNGPNAVR